MPTTNLIMGGMGGHGASTVDIIASGGNVMRLPIAPREFTADGGAEITQLERQGLEALTRIDGPKKNTLSFTATFGRVDPRRSIDTMTAWITRRKNEGRRIKFRGMPAEFAGWWLIESAPVQVTLMTPDHRISRATIDFSLVQFKDITTGVYRRR